jgi:hypothetical protein
MRSVGFLAPWRRVCCCCCCCCWVNKATDLTNVQNGRTPVPDRNNIGRFGKWRDDGCQQISCHKKQAHSIYTGRTIERMNSRARRSLALRQATANIERLRLLCISDLYTRMQHTSTRQIVQSPIRPDAWWDSAIPTAATSREQLHQTGHRHIICRLCPCPQYDLILNRGASESLFEAAAHNWDVIGCGYGRLYVLFVSCHLSFSHESARSRFTIPKLAHRLSWHQRVQRRLVGWFCVMCEVNQLSHSTC